MKQLVCLALVMCACGGTAPVQREVELGWGRPDDAEPVEAFAVDHPLRGVAEAVAAGDCASVVSRSRVVEAFLESEIARVLRVPPPVTTRRPLGERVEGISGPLDTDGPTIGNPDVGIPQTRERASGVDAEAARRLLDETIYREPPLLEVAEYGFRAPRWWSRSYGYCLAEEGELDAAAEVFTLLLWEEIEPDTLWRLALVSVWAGRPAVALSVLEAWPDGAERPAAYEALMARLLRGESVPFDTRSARLSLD